MDLSRIALVLIRIYGAAYIAMGLGWLFSWILIVTLGAQTLKIFGSHLEGSGGIFFASGLVYLFAGITIIGSARSVMRFVTRA